MIAIVLALAAVTHQDTAGLDRAVAAFTGHAIGEDGGARAAVDARLRLAQCPTVAMSWRTPAQDAVVVACSGPDWRLYVPVQRRTPIAAPDNSGVAPGPVAVAAVRAAPVIKRGDPVLIEAGSPGFSITREGTALGDAPPGGRVMIRVDGAKAPVQGVAVEAGRATLPGWQE